MNREQSESLLRELRRLENRALDMAMSPKFSESRRSFYDGVALAYSNAQRLVFEELS